MSPLDAVDQEQLKQFLLRNWMTHDAMWFVQAVNEVGMERANALNRAAVRAMAGVEAKRLLRLLGMTGVRNPEELRRFFEAVRALLIGDFMEFDWAWSPDGRTVRFEMRTCFAYEGVAKLGVAEQYECGIYERIYGWLDALGLPYEVTPDVVHCTMHHDGECVREVQITLPDGE